MSKYIPKSRIPQSPSLQSMWTWQNKPTKEDLKQREETEKYYNHLSSEKARIESIPLEELTFRDLYEFPFHQAKYGSWVYDNKSNFIFQFEFHNKDTRKKCLRILNGELLDYKRQDVMHERGEIFVNGEHFITIRGW